MRPDASSGIGTIEQLAQTVLVLPEARWGDQDPTRRQLAERAQRVGISISPRLEVQHAIAALELASRGLGDTVVTRALVEALGYGNRVTTTPLDPPLRGDVRIRSTTERTALTRDARAHDSGGGVPSEAR